MNGCEKIRTMVMSKYFLCFVFSMYWLNLFFRRSFLFSLKKSPYVLVPIINRVQCDCKHTHVFGRLVFYSEKGEVFAQCT